MSFLLLSSSYLWAEEAAVVPLDRSVRLESDDEVISSVFKDVVVVQRKAKKKAGKFLFNFSTTFDFADGPITMWAVNTNFGYAISNFFEIYLNYVPTYIVNERSIVSKVRALTLVGNVQADIAYSKPTNGYGVDFLWLPAYGKDSFGPYSIVRSDSFFKVTAGVINYASGESGSKMGLMIGKTYFLSEYFNMRISGGMAQYQTIIQSEKTNSMVALLDGGLVFYF